MSTPTTRAAWDVLTRMRDLIACYDAGKIALPEFLGEARAIAMPPNDSPRKDQNEHHD